MYAPKVNSPLQTISCLLHMPQSDVLIDVPIDGDYVLSHPSVTLALCDCRSTHDPQASDAMDVIEDLRGLGGTDSGTGSLHSNAQSDLLHDRILSRHRQLYFRKGRADRRHSSFSRSSCHQHVNMRARTFLEKGFDLLQSFGISQL